VVPAAVRDLFVAMAGVPDRQFLLRLSMLEIYNEVRHNYGLVTSQCCLNQWWTMTQSRIVC